MAFLIGASVANDPYKILGVPRQASAGEIRGAYRELASRLHPDARPNDRRAAAQFRLISDAYELLNNQAEREQYDASHPETPDIPVPEIVPPPLRRTRTSRPRTDVTRPRRAQPVKYEAALAVSAHDRVSSFIVAMLYLLGFLVVLMFLVWLTTRASRRVAPIAVEYLDELAGGEASLGDGRDFEQPGVDDIQDLATPDAQDLLSAVTDVASTLQASSDSFVGNVSQGSSGGDRRQKGEGGDAAVPRWQRWEVRFTATGLTQYAQQLEAFQIELAAVGGGREEVDYASGFTAPQPQRRSAPGEQEQRLYMSYRRGQLQQFDRQLLRKAGIPTEGRTLLQFYPPQVQNTLAALEQKAAKGRPLREIRKTIFAVRGSGSSYRFEVVDQLYR